MKIFNFLLFILLIIINTSIKAQDTTSLEEQVATAISLLPTADITTDLLYDRIPEYFPFKYLDGINVGDSVYLNKDRFQMSYGMIASANIDSFTGIPIDSMWHLVEEFSEEETVYFGGMYYDYHMIRRDAVDSGWITTDSTYFYDNTPQDTSLYEQKRFFGMSALKEHAAGPLVTFQFDTTYMFTNIGFDTASMEVDFDDGNG